MAAPVSGSELRELAERLLLATSGFLGGGRRDDARSLVDELVGRWRGDAVRISEKTRVSLAGAFRELGLVTRDDFDELELRIAQLEHRLRLVEKP
jgi:polyhydroxyalkanoate synthesis regulator phasin